MSLRLITDDSCPGDDASPEQPPCKTTSYSVDRDGECTLISRHPGDAGPFSTFEEAKEDAIFWMEELIGDIQTRIEEIRTSETYEDYEKR